MQYSHITSKLRRDTVALVAFTAVPGLYLLASDLPQVAEAHTKIFHKIRTAISILMCQLVSPDILVEFEVDAILGASDDHDQNPA